MKDPISEYIEKNRPDLDTETPDESLWNKIHSELHPKKRKRFIYGLSAACAILLIGFGYYWMNKVPTKTNEIAIEASDVDSLKQKQIGDGLKKDPGNFQYDKMKLPPNYHPFKESKAGNDLDVGQFNKNGLNNAIKKHQAGDQAVQGNLSDKNRRYRGNTFKSKVLAEENLQRRNYRNSNNIDYLEGVLKTSHYTYKVDVNQNGTYMWSGFAVADSTITFENEEPQYGISYYYEQYDDLEENKYEEALKTPLSTFSIDVDGASYSNSRRYIMDGMLPPKNSIRIEEYMNYFSYNLKRPTSNSKHPFEINSEVGICPWNIKHQLVQITIKGKEISMENVPASNLVFLIDVSGSMESPDKLGLLKQGLKLLTNQLRANDKVSIVVYAGAAGQVLAPTSGSNKQKIEEAIENLSAGGSTAGGEGIELP